MKRVLASVALLLAAAGAAAQEINAATRAQLESLPGIGVTMADRILVERDRAPFASWDDFERRVKGMRGTRSERLRAQGATVNGERESRAPRSERGKRAARAPE